MGHGATLRCLTILAAALGPAVADVHGDVTVRVADATSLKGQGINRLVGHGLIVGLNGTGDGDDYAVTMRALAQTLGNLAAPVNALEELKDTRNVALVLLDAVVPENGAREGDRVDVHVSAIGSAKSLTGGRLVVSPLVYADPQVTRVFAFASGPVETADATTPTVGMIHRGAAIHEDVLVGFTAFGRELPFRNPWIQPEEQYVTLVLDEHHAGWGLAVAIAEAINAELSLAADVERVAMAVDPKNVVALVPTFQRGDAASWIRDIEELSVLVPAEEARVTVDRTTGTIAVSGDARISPVIVSQKGMTVTVRTLTTDDARIEQQTFAALSTDRQADADVSDLLQALNQLQVPIDDRIAILTQIQKAGKLHAKLVHRE